MEKKLQQMYIVMGALCLILVCSSLAMAANGGVTPNSGLPEEDSLTATVPWPAASSTSRLAAYVKPAGMVRAKGVAALTHPSVGIYCIKPSSTFINIKNVVPIVSVEWGHSSGSALLAYYFDYTQFSGGDCPVGYLEVQTYNFGTGTPVLDDTVAFTIIVP